MGSETDRTGQRYTVALFLVVALFFMWGVANNLNDILIAQFRKAFELTDMQAGLVQSAFYLGYFCFSIPASMFMRRKGYKGGVVVGLILYAAGAILFIPAAEARQYSFFLFALFVIASGLAFLETSANPFVAALGPPETADRRLNFAQAFNPLGSITGVVIGKYFIFSGLELTPSERAEMPPEALDAFLVAEVEAVQGPYAVIAGTVLLWALLVLITRFPTIDTIRRDRPTGGVLNLFDVAYARLWFGVLAQFFYVGAQVGIWSYLIPYAQYAIPDVGERNAADYLTLSLVLFMIGRFVGTALMLKVRATTLMAAFALINAVLMLVGILFASTVGLLALVASSLFMSIMFPTIFSVSLRGLGEEAKSASSLIVMAIIGGAVLTALMGWVSDISSINWAFAVPLVSFLVVAGFASVNSASYRPLTQRG